MYGEYVQCAPLLQHENIVVLLFNDKKFSLAELDTQKKLVEYPMPSSKLNIYQQLDQPIVIMGL